MYAIHSWYILDARPSDASNTVIVQVSFRPGYPNALARLEQVREEFGDVKLLADGAEAAT